jgi:hypothetical protein
MVREMLLAITVVTALCYAAVSAWQLWARHPSRYASVFGESLLPFGMLLVMISLPRSDTLLDIVARIVIVAGFATATILRLIARRRFAVES